MDNILHSPFSILHSQFWQALTPSNTFVMCWQNVPWNRDVHYPFSFMIEFEEKGDITFRYDLTNVKWRMENGEWVENSVLSNDCVGVMNNGLGRTFNALPTNVTSLKWSRVTEADRETSDRDGDGLPTVDEILIHHTNPDLADSDCDGSDDAREIATGSDPTVRDSDGDGLVDGSDPHPTSAEPLDDLDGDGIPDVYESHWFGGTNAVDAADVRDGTGFTLSDKILAGMNPTNAVFATETVVTNRFLSWKLWDGFAMERSSSSTNLVFERTIRIDRTSAWQRFYLSASPGSAEGWCLEGASLEWNGPDGEVRAVNRSPFGDSLPLELPETCDELTLRLRADSSLVVSRQPLYLIAYSPDTASRVPRSLCPTDGPPSSSSRMMNWRSPFPSMAPIVRAMPIRLTMTGSLPRSPAPPDSSSRAILRAVSGGRPPVASTPVRTSASLRPARHHVYVRFVAPRHRTSPAGRR